MITKEQAVYLMTLVDAVDDTSAAMVRAVGGDPAEYVEASIEWDLAYEGLRAFVASITETNE